MTASRLGVLAGLGPLAGAHFYRRLIELTPAQQDGDHVSVVLVAEPAIPSRREFLAGRGVSPVPALQQAARELQQVGCDLIVMPSTTTHAFYEDVASSVTVPVLNLLVEVTDALVAAHVAKPAIIATRATVQTQIYEPHFVDRITPIYPPPEIQDRIEHMIDAVKGGADTEALRADMDDVAAAGWLADADGILLACTETPLIAPTGPDLNLVSATDVLALAALRELGRQTGP